MRAPNYFLAFPIAADDWFPQRLGEIPDGFRLLHPADLHLTVAFLGAVHEAEALACWEPACAVAPRHALHLHGGEVLPMGRPEHWSALALQADSAKGEVAAWMAAHRADLQACSGTRRDPRPPRPHLTLGRLHGQEGRRRREEIAAWGHALDLGGLALRADRLALMTRAEPGAERRFRELRTQAFA